MSGTSLDGIDGVLVEFNHSELRVLNQAQIPYPDALRSVLTALLTPGENEIERTEQASAERNKLALALIENLCKGVDRTVIAAIADHGQTIRHYPDANPAYTVQLHRAAELAEQTGIDCVVDFRSKDVAAGGQGAPLVPAFHQAYFADPEQYRVVVNIGGLANISLLAPGRKANSVGFDTGPGNTLLDSWCQQHTDATYDIDGAWAASGQINRALLADLMADPYFNKTPPKSTGREHFNPAWLTEKLSTGGHETGNPANIQASLTALTAHSIALGVQQACAQADIPETSLEGIYVCGGGAHNPVLMQQLAAQTLVPLSSSERLGIPPQWVEATAFAWLGKQAIEGRTVDIKCTTGARHNNILGVRYQA